MQATNSNKQSQSYQEESSSSSGNNKRMLSSAKSSACASQHQQQSHQSNHSRTTAHEYVNVKNPCRRNSQAATQNAKPLYRSESVHRAQMLPSSAVKNRNDHKNDNHQQDYSNDMNRGYHESRHNGKPMTDIYADDAAEVKNQIILNKPFLFLLLIFFFFVSYLSLSLLCLWNEYSSFLMNHTHH